ncbi:MAG: SEC-C metal-binding domain-containing protein [Muribaculaceae bacterium]|nr:SEC-C metal-binding domain-containing protein [Muribaculaceae bacterium]
MNIQERLDSINAIIKNIADFIQADEVVRADFNEYLRTISANTKSQVPVQAACFSYILERNLGEDLKSIPQLYLENSKGLDKYTKDVVEAIDESISSVFEIKKVTKTGFELLNIVNERKYMITSLMKMTSFRGLGSGDYIIARIVNINGDYFLLEISGVLPGTKKDDAYRFAVAKIIQNPELVYLDNPEKQAEVEADVADIYKKFVEFFGTTEIITTNKFADNLIGLFNDYAEEGTKADYSELIAEPDEYKFFNVSEFNNSYDNFLENSLGGFSSHKEIYDVGIIYDEELGLYAIPFYGTFNKIFEVKDYTKILNYDSCIKYFLQNDKYSANLIRTVASKHKNFMEIVNSVLAKNYSLDKLLNKYKRRYINNKIISSTTVLYRSNAFSSTLGLIEDNESRPQIDTTQKIGRNDPCPCGSGKKYKKCCGAAVLQR